jgi:hypothetical protein
MSPTAALVLAARTASWNRRAGPAALVLRQFESFD